MAACCLLLVWAQPAPGVLLANAYWHADYQHAAADGISPGKPEAWVARVDRGRNPVSLSADGFETQTEDLGTGGLAIGVFGADDRTPLDKLGFRLQLASGTLPPRLRIPEVALSPLVGRGAPVLTLYWPDWDQGFSNHDAGYRFALLLTCLDLNGNKSIPSDTLWVTLPGR